MIEGGCGPPIWSICTVTSNDVGYFCHSANQPYFSEWKSVGLELTNPMMYHTCVLVISKVLKKFPVVWCGK